MKRNNKCNVPNGKVLFLETEAGLFQIIQALNYLSLILSETVSFFLPFARREARTLRPLGVDILSLKPCLFTLFLLEGWYVLFISLYFNSLFFRDRKDIYFLKKYNGVGKFSDYPAER